jgi:DNA-binding MarR family transcriptional regulator
VKLTAADATRIVSFCLGRRYELELAKEGSSCFMKVSPLNRSAPAQCFEADSFEQVLRVAAEAGIVRKECIERQIAFCTSADARGLAPRIEDTNERAAAPGTVPDRPGEPPPCVSPAHYLGLAELRYHMRRFDTLSEGAARSVGLEAPQHQVLLAVAGLPSSKRATLATLAERLCIDLEHCQRLTDVVVHRGMARWTPNLADRRETLLALTDAGRATVSRLTSLDRLQILTLGPRLVQALGTILSSRED